MIRLSGRAYAVAQEEQDKWMDRIFEEQPYLANVYPGDTRSIGIVFCIDAAEVEYFNLGINPIFRDTYRLGNVTIKEHGYYINRCMHRVRHLCGELPAELHHSGCTICDRAKSLPALWRLL